MHLMHRGSYWNIPNADKQIAIIAALAEGSSIRAIEHMAGTRRDTFMRLCVKGGPTAYNQSLGCNQEH